MSSRIPGRTFFTISSRTPWLRDPLRYISLRVTVCCSSPVKSVGKNSPNSCWAEGNLCSSLLSFSPCLHHPESTVVFCASLCVQIMWSVFKEMDKRISGASTRLPFGFPFPPLFSLLSFLSVLFSTRVLQMYDETQKSKSTSEALFCQFFNYTRDSPVSRANIFPASH